MKRVRQAPDKSCMHTTHGIRTSRVGERLYLPDWADKMSVIVLAVLYLSGFTFYATAVTFSIALTGSRAPHYAFERRMYAKPVSPRKPL